MNKRAALTGLTMMLGIGLASGLTGAQQNPRGLVKPDTAKIVDAFTPLMPGETRLEGGWLGTRVSNSEKNRLLHVDETDMLDAFERRDAPHQDWQGEHAGKFLHAATLAWNYTHDAALKAKLDRVATRLIKTQEADGYLGTYPVKQRWTSWDVWVHKYDMLGLLTYYQFTQDSADKNTRALSKAALQTSRRVGDLLIRTFGTGPGQRDINRAGEHMGMAADTVLEPIVLLYRATADPRYLKFAHYIVTNYNAPGGPRVLDSLEKYHSVRKVANGKAYEMESNFNGLLELYRATGDKRLLNDMRIGWEDIVKNRLYLTGSASSFEVFQDEYHLPNRESSNICETCVSVTWEQMNLQLLRLTGDPRYADQLERTIYNHLMAAQKPTGDMWSYYTPLEGHKPYGNETNCCLSSGPRGMALIPTFATMTGRDGSLIVNLYNSGTVSTDLLSGKVTVREETAYPLNGKVVLHVRPEKSGQKFALRLRIPAWTPKAAVSVNGGPAKAVAPGTYADVDRAWISGDVVTLSIALPVRLVRGDHENEGKAAALYGPLVLALDAAQNPAPRLLRAVAIAADSTRSLSLTPAPDHSLKGEPVFRTGGSNGGTSIPIYLTPYAFAGQDGKSRFKVWIPRAGSVETRKSASVLADGDVSVSRQGNASGEITDDDYGTYTVTYNGKAADEDWYAIAVPAPVTISRVIYAHGRTFHDGGWFDSSNGKPRIQVRTEPNGEWKTVATLDSYPDTTATDAKGMQEGQTFEVKFAPITVVAVRIAGKPSPGDSPQQSFSSCGELQGFAE